jgi:polysaccharide deacetylase family protein (PEP-CTERM system associated)
VTAPTFLASFDVEDWFHAHNLASRIPRSRWDMLERRVEWNTNELLDILGELGLTSTFFVLGWVARRHPQLVRRMVDEGHEVASHSDEHRQLATLSRAALTRDLADARDALEQASGVPIRGLRAPTFSISDDVLDCLSEAGYWYDSSYFALRAHDRYGQLSGDVDAESSVVEVRPGLLELPMSRVAVGPLAIPWSGGAYFRLIPYPIYRRGVGRRLRARSWFLFYFHPWELDIEEPSVGGLGVTKRLRAYTGRARMRADLRRLLAEFGSSRIDTTLLGMGYRPPAL